MNFFMVLRSNYWRSDFNGLELFPRLGERGHRSRTVPASIFLQGQIVQAASTHTRTLGRNGEPLWQTAVGESSLHHECERYSTPNRGFRRSRSPADVMRRNVAMAA